ncbi:hypothetical protein GGS21DRAFT_495511 [Xylaria nigripes]|nr:hypothetical protein GGS21DRAFT_495511 [Xylaria nigripes]
MDQRTRVCVCVWLLFSAYVKSTTCYNNRIRTCRTLRTICHLKGETEVRGAGSRRYMRMFGCYTLYTSYIRGW